MKNEIKILSFPTIPTGWISLSDGVHDSYTQNTYFLVSEVEFDKYIHFVFSAWTISMLFFSIIIFGGQKGILLRSSIDVWFAGLNVFFARKFLFFSQVVLKNCVEVLRVGYLFSYKLLDKGLYEVVFAYGVVSVITDVLGRLKLLHRGSLYQYAGTLWLVILLSSMALL